MTIQIRPAPLHITQSGSGPSVIMLHGSASSSRQWQGTRDYIEGRFDVISPDLPGYGRSSSIVRDRALSLEEIVIALQPAFDRANGPVHLVGHSFGAAVALKAATILPDRVQSLSLIEPAAFNLVWQFSGLDTPATQAFLRVAQGAKAAYAMGDHDTGMRLFFGYWAGPGSWERTSSDMKDRLRPQLGQICRDFDALINDRTTEYDLAGVVCPTQCLFGSNTPPAMEAVKDAIINSVPFATTATVPGAGHMVPMTDPHVVDPWIADFLVKTDIGWQTADIPMSVAA